jgi:uncharacterized repeat protein (TIGR02543 family)
MVGMGTMRLNGVQNFKNISWIKVIMDKIKITPKLVAILVVLILYVLSFEALDSSELFSFADNISTAPTNVTYFEGYGINLDKEALHDITRISSLVDDTPSITIFVHGQGGNASHWSNDGKGHLSYDTASLVEKIRNDSGGANVYWAQMAKDADNDGLDDVFTYLNPKTSTELVDTYIQFHPYSVNNFFLTKLNVGKYNVDNEKPDTQEFISKITDVSKHSIILFEAANSIAYHRTVYEELHTLIDSISYDILYLTGRIPTVNLISHSRGGINSMMYATGYKVNSKTALVDYDAENEDNNFTNAGEIIHDHPFNVSALYSMGTPYDGTKLNQSWAESIIGENTFNNPSARNINDPIIQEEIKGNWETAVAVNPNLKLYASAGEISLNFLLGLIADDRETLASRLDDVDDNPDGKYEKLDDLFLMLTDEWMPEFVKYLRIISGVTAVASAGGILFLPPPLNTISFVVGETIQTTCLVLHENAAYIQKQAFKAYNEPDLAAKLLILDDTIMSYYCLLYNFQDAFLGLAEDKLGVGSFGDFGDLFVNTDSQLANGFSNVERYKKIFSYEEINISEEENGIEFLYFSRNFDIDKTTTPDVAIVHNLETYDSMMHKQIRNNISLGVPSTIYDYVELPDGTVKISDVMLPDYYTTAPFMDLELSLLCGINGKNVTYIDSNSFADFTNLKNIILPDYVEVIGDRAFENCLSLYDTFNLPKGLKYYGTSVFYNCPKITAFSISNNTKYYTLDGVLYAQQEYCTNGGLVYSIINNSQGKTLLEYPNGKNDTLFTIPTDVVNIADYAISKNAFLKSITLNNIKNIGAGAFSESNNFIVINDGTNVDFVGENAFYSTKWLNYNAQPFVSLGKVLIKYNGTSSELTLNNYKSVSAFAFYDNTTLQKITFDTNLEYIGQNAFSNCTKLVSVTLLNREKFVETGENAFENNATNRKIYVSNSLKPQYQAFINLTKYSSSLTPITTSVTFDSQGGTSVASKTAYYGANEAFSSPSKANYNFDGWHLNDTKIVSSSVWTFYDTAVALTAKWTPQTYIILLNLMDGTNASTNIMVSYNVDMPTNGLSVPTRDGYNFGGYYDNINGTGKQYYTATMSSARKYNDTQAKSLFAYWIGNPYIISFNVQGGIGGTQSLMATYGSAMPQATTPTREGYSFCGYYTKPNGMGTQYYTSTMASSNYYAILGSITLHAYWQIETFEIKIDSQSQWMQINSNQLNITNFQISIPFGTSVNETINSALIKVYQNKNGIRAGYTLLGFYRSADTTKTQINWGNSIPDLGDAGAVITLNPLWQANTYTVTLDNQDASLLPRFTANNCTPTLESASSSDIVYVYFVPKTSGTITLWTSHTSGDPYLYLYDYNKIRLTYNDDGYGNLDSKITYAVTAGVAYYAGFRAWSSKTIGAIYCSGVSLNLATNFMATSTSTTVTATYEKALPTAQKPTLTGYTFNGYYTDQNSTGTQLYNSQMSGINAWSIADNGTIYASWTPNTYTITLDKQGETNGTSSVTATYNQLLPSATIPIKQGYTFEGYFGGTNGGGIQYYSSNMASISLFELTSATTIYAKWTLITYAITYNFNGGTTSETYEQSYTIATSVTLPIPTKTGYAFSGWTGTNVTNNVVNTSKNLIGNITVVANWSATLYTYTSSVTTTITGSTSIVDLTNAPANDTYVFTISTAVNEVTFKSASRTFSSLRIIINSRSTALILRVWTISFVAPSNYHSILATGNFRLTLAYEGTCGIVGGNNSVVGANRGYAAVYNATSSAIVALKGKGSLTLTGGIGSTGSVGTNGSKGSNGSDASIIIGNGGKGSAGSAGGTGGTGGIGGYSVYAAKLIIESISGTINLKGGKGGVGGVGGNGGEGGRGGHGGGSLAIAMNGGDGGTGGKGGTGGNGGAGGSYSNVSYSKANSLCITPSISAGLQGAGGKGGIGGDGGYGGANGPSLFKSGSHGNGAAGGIGGEGGTGSTMGAPGRSGYTGGYWYC